MASLWDADQVLHAWNYAAEVHHGQCYPGSDIAYIKHVATVTMEVMNALPSAPAIDAGLAVQCAILHDTIEDTAATYHDIEARFGSAVADGVQALSKNKALATKAEQMADSLQRIQQQPHAIWMVKMADRIANLQTPPDYWRVEKITAYRQEAILILETLCRANDYLARRLQAKIDCYPN